MGIAEGCPVKSGIFLRIRFLTYDRGGTANGFPGGEAAPGARCLLCIKAPGYGVSHLEWGEMSNQVAVSPWDIEYLVSKRLDRMHFLLQLTKVTKL